jgi:hypothetical protein
MLADPALDVTAAWAADTIYASNRIARHYAGLWAYGYGLLPDTQLKRKGWHVGRGETDVFYRMLSSLAVTALDPSGTYQIWDIGCGVGRCIHDLSGLFPKSLVTGIDISDTMLAMASSILFQTGEIVVDLSDAGFGAQTLDRDIVPLRDNALLIQANAEHLPIRPAGGGSGLDLAMLINVLDRTPNPDLALIGAASAVRRGGYLMLAMSGSWENVRHWQNWGDGLEWCLTMLGHYGYELSYAVDRVPLREIINHRLAVEEYPVSVLMLRRVRVQGITEA